VVSGAAPGIHPAEVAWPMPIEALEGRILLGRYRIARQLGAGAHGRVYLAEDLVRGGERLALKLVEGLVGAGSDDPAQRVLRWFRHPSWAEILDAGRCGEYDWFQATRYVEGRSLAQLEGPQPVEWVWRLLEDGARVLRALHRRGLIHYDVTPGNVLVEGPDDAPRFVLTDGGLANVGPVHGFARGTPLYMAPEVTEDRHHDHRADLYSLGLVAYRLATGTDPHSGGAGDVLGRRRREPAPHVRERRPELPEALDALICALLDPDPGRRPASGDALLARLAEARPGTPDVLPAEAVAAATSGALIGRDAVLARFGRLLDTLVERVPHTAQDAPPHHPEQVLLLEGPSGSGATRLARELAAAARVQEIPVMLLAGREGAPDRRNPLRRLVDGLVTLQRTPDGAAPQVALAARGSGSADRDDLAHSDGRAIEKFLAVVEECARRTPFALVVEDFTDLPALAQEAVRVLSRHLLGRSERATGQTPLPVVLVVDLGHESAERLANPDSVDMRRSVAALPALTLDEISRLAAERFPGLALPQSDLTTLAHASDSQPANLTTLLAEAYRRGDLRCEEGAWTWNVERVSSYGISRRLPPPQEEALRAAPPALRRFLDRLALAESEVPLPAARELWSRLGAGDVPSSRLLSVREHGDSVLLALATPALRRVLLDAQVPSARAVCAADLLTALDAHPDPRTLIDRVSLQLELARASGALALAHEQAPALTPDQRAALQPLLLRIAQHDATLLSNATSRRQLIALLHRGSDAVATANLLSPHVPRTADDLPDILSLATILEDAYQLDALSALLSSATSIPSAPLHLLADLHIRRARVEIARRRSGSARPPLAQARRALAALGPRKVEWRRILVEYLKARAHDSYSRDRLKQATRLLRYAIQHARRANSTALYATTLNNLGIICRAAGDLQGAEAHLRRALRLRRPLGDITGTIGTQYNLARVYLSQGSPPRAAARLQEAAALAARHNLAQLLVTCLRELAGALDQLDSPHPALDCLRRGLRTSARGGLAAAGARIAHEQMTLAMLLGEFAAYREAYTTSLQTARIRAFADARALHYLSIGLSGALCGLLDRTRWAVARIERYEAQLTREDRAVCRALRLATSDPLAPRAALLTQDRRPSTSESGRLLLRTSLLTLRTLGRRAGPNMPIRLPRRWARHAQNAPRERRLSAAMLLAVTHRHRGTVATEVLKTLAGACAGPCDALLQARTLAVRAVEDPAISDGARSELLSSALRPFTSSRDLLPRSMRALPVELSRAGHELCSTSALNWSDTSSLMGLHAAVHARLLQVPQIPRAESRRVTALRQLLAATSQFEAGVDLDTLLQRLTRVMLSVTGAQRACIVVLEPGSGLDPRIATSVSTAGEPVRAQELSHTVIQRVLSTRSALLMHDAFGDEELLGRPSVTALSLRSILCVPMQRNGTVLGVLYADSSAGAGSFDQGDLEIMALLAEQASAALEAHRLVANLQGAYAELRTMQERLVRSERLRVLGEVSSGVAHEFNNLLTAILARVQLMGLASHDPEQKAHLQLLEKAAMDAAGVVRRLQTFSRHERTGKFVVVDVAEVCNDAVEFLRPLWSTRRRHGRPPVTVRLSCQPGLRVMGNPTELREVLTNLIKNSLDALGEKGGQIQVHASSPSSGIVTLRVGDDGPGIPPENLSRLFTPFFTTKGEGGTGLGLCLSQRLVEQHGGDLKLESGAQAGTVATITLPQQVPSARGAIPTPLAPQAAQGHGIAVLVVDDDAEVLRPLCSYLEQAGYRVATARDGHEAIDQLRAARTDVLLTDIGMPRMDGLELCRRAHALQPKLPVVLMSGWASDVDHAKARAVGAQALLAKPFAMQQVCDILRRMANSASPT
jgi:signal transduction histidine kinase/CheY-like chemotaxis protein/tetratricopeptide (TPR) repeat protein